eukprot:CAMPEP_0194203706 /NCGR_PEP_ID=MMETSP0156-20130528/3409_1 /TAXON_ID=33649 /ORGANISM="Thalassionema nitzschioides, Strain L26-B" /LENGTH=240 /DNA_ID=CAMNT_0038929507 /DNA_START=130 /DNA_END=852 /DNA_ORIENTATION=-
MTFPVRFANYSQLSASGISLSSLSMSTLSSGYRYWQEGCIDIPIVFALGIPAVISARVGSGFAKKLSSDALSLFFNSFSIVLIPTHYYIQQRADHRASQQDRVIPDKSHSSEKLAQHAIMGLFSGVISALMGVGGLPFIMSYITEATHLPHHHVQGTTVCALVPSIIVSAVSRMKAIPVGTAGLVAAGAMVGSQGGASVSLSLSEERLRQIYMLSLVVFGGRSMIGAIRNIRDMMAKKNM